MAKMNNKVYGIIGESVKMANPNADFDKLPKSLANGKLMCSYNSLKYTIKREWDREDEKVFGLKSVDDNEKVVGIDERYKNLFGKYADNKNISEVLYNLLSCIDITNFGVTFAGKASLGITGVIQISNGENKYEDANVNTSSILAQFQPKEDKTGTTIGSVNIIDEAHYTYSFVVNPKEYDKYVNDKFEGYTREHYEKFKNASLVSISNHNSTSKQGCQNEFALFVELKDDVKGLMNLNQLDQYVKVYDSEEYENKRVYDLTDVENILSSANIKENIKRIEIYYNPYTLKIKGELEGKKFNIITMEEI